MDLISGDRYQIETANTCLNVERDCISGILDPGSAPETYYKIFKSAESSDCDECIDITCC